MCVHVYMFDRDGVDVFFPANLCLRGVLWKKTSKTIHRFPLVRPETLGLNKGLGCKQSSLGFKHVITTVRPFVIIEQRVTSWNTTQCKSHIVALNGTRVQTDIIHVRQMAQQRGQESFMDSNGICSRGNEVHLFQCDSLSFFFVFTLFAWTFFLLNLLGGPAQPPICLPPCF